MNGLNNNTTTTTKQNLINYIYHLFYINIYIYIKEPNIENSCFATTKK